MKSNYVDELTAYKDLKKDKKVEKELTNDQKYFIDIIERNQKEINRLYSEMEDCNKYCIKTRESISKLKNSSFDIFGKRNKYITYTAFLVAIMGGYLTGVGIIKLNYNDYNSMIMLFITLLSIAYLYCVIIYELYYYILNIRIFSKIRNNIINKKEEDIAFYDKCILNYEYKIKGLKREILDIRVKYNKENSSI